jgi:hypothetical protein
MHRSMQGKLLDWDGFEKYLILLRQKTVRESRRRIENDFTTGVRSSLKG